MPTTTSAAATATWSSMILATGLTGQWQKCTLAALERALDAFNGFEVGWGAAVGVARHAIDDG